MKYFSFKLPKIFVLPFHLTFVLLTECSFFKKTGNKNGAWYDSNLGPVDHLVNALTIAPLNLMCEKCLKYNYRIVKKNISRVIRRSSDCVGQIKWSTTLQHTLVGRGVILRMILRMILPPLEQFFKNSNESLI